MFRYFRSLSSPYMAEATNHTDVCWHVKSPNMCRKGWGMHVDLKALTSCDTLDDMSTWFFIFGYKFPFHTGEIFAETYDS